MLFGFQVISGLVTGRLTEMITDEAGSLVAGCGRIAQLVRAHA